MQLRQKEQNGSHKEQQQQGQGPSSATNHRVKTAQRQGGKAWGLGRPSTNQLVRTEKARETLPEVTCLLHGTGILQGWELAGSPSTSH